MSAYTNRPGDPAAAQVIAITSPDEALCAALQQIESAVSQSQASRKRIADRVHALSQQHEQLKGEHDSVKAELSSAKAACEKALRRSETLERELSEIRNRYAQLRESAKTKLDAYAAREDKFRSTILAERDSKRELEVEFTSRISTLEESLKQAQTDLSLYKSAWSKAMQAQHDAQSYVEERKSLSRNIQELELKNSALVAENKERIAAIQAELQRTRLEGKASLAEVQGKLDAALRENETIQKKSAQLENQIQLLNARLETLSEARDKAAGERDKASHDLDAALRIHEKEKAILKLQAQQARTEAEALIAEMSSKADALADLMNEQLKKSSVALDAASQAHEKELSELQQKIDRLESRSIEARSVEVRVDALTDEFEKASQERMRAEQERDHLKALLAQAIEEKNRAQKTYPLRDLVKHKESEVSRAANELSHLAPEHPARKQAENILSTLIDQRDQLKSILESSND